MNPVSSWPELVFWQEGDRRCELWMAKGVPELRLFARNTLFYKERAPLDSLQERAEKLRARRIES